MNDGFTWWLVILGIAIGVALVWLFMAQLPRHDGDVDEAELAREAAWISRTIDAYGGVAPQPLVEEVLELHQQYLATGTAEPVSEEPVEATDSGAAGSATRQQPTPPAMAKAPAAASPSAGASATDARAEGIAPAVSTAGSSSGPSTLLHDDAAEGEATDAHHASDAHDASGAAQATNSQDADETEDAAREAAQLRGDS